VKKYIRNPRKMEMTNAGSAVQNDKGNDEKKVQVHEEGSSDSKKTSEGNGGKD
tara:strand:- start:18462 stop:18620 length:159 start_codon:yes stop_codon:yes gene_type:complete